MTNGVSDADIILKFRTVFLETSTTVSTYQKTLNAAELFTFLALPPAFYSVLTFIAGALVFIITP